MDTETEDLALIGGLGLLAYLLWRRFGAASGMTPGSVNLPNGKSWLQQALDSLTAAGPAVVQAVQGAVHAGDTSVVAQAHTVSVTGGDPTLQGTAIYTDPSLVPDPRVQAAWSEFVGKLQEIAAAAPPNDAALGTASKVYQGIRQYAPYFAAAAAAAGYPIVTSIGAAASSQLGIGGILGGGAIGVYALDAGLLTYGIGSLIESFGNTYAQSPADAALAQSTASALLTGDKQLADDAQAVAEGTATADQAAYVQAHTLSAAQMQNLTTDAQLAAGVGSKQLWDPSAPGGYITVGGSYGVKQAQTAAQNKAEAQAAGTTVGGTYHTGNSETGLANQ